MSAFDRRRVAALTEKHGGEWAIHHAHRLIRLVAIIGEGRSYNADAIWIAAHMHDWGTFPHWSREDVSHSRRSCELAETHLRRMKCPKALMELVLEAIAYHHGGAGEHSIEAILLSDADALDGMGTIGVLREFAMVPTEVDGCYSVPTGWGMRGAYERARMRLENNPKMLHLPKSRQIARRRAREMGKLFESFEAESFGMI
jgi:HD superfamily phosphodiesterase